MTITTSQTPDLHDSEDLVAARAANLKTESEDTGSIDVSADAARKRSGRRPLLLMGLGVIGIVAVAAGWVIYAHAMAHESTDDAFIEAHVVQVSPKISGYAGKVAVEDNQHVNKGDLLVQIDPRDQEARLNESNANLLAAQNRLNEAHTNVQVLQAMVDAAKAAVVAMQADADYAGAQASRYEQVPAGAASQQDKASAVAQHKAAEANLNATQSKVAAAEAQLANAKAQETTAAAQVTVAESQARQAELNLSYTKITAPDSGRVTRRSVESGAYVQVGEALLAIVPDDVWVVANFKETQLDHMRPGQPATIRIDAYPAKTYSGHVDSIQAGTGARFSLLPPENATGNYVKVVQRVPVKIVFDEKLPPELSMAPGMSVVPDVKVK